MINDVWATYILLICISFCCFHIVIVTVTDSRLPSMSQNYLPPLFSGFPFAFVFWFGAKFGYWYLHANSAGLAFVVYRFYVGIGCVRELWIKIQKNKLVLLMVLSWKIIGFKKCFYFADMNKEIVVNFRLMMLDWCFKWVENLWTKKDNW